MSQALRSVLRAMPRTSPISVASYRPYHASNPRMAYKDSQDRESLKPGSTENTKTGRDQDMANENPDAAFNPSKTSPEAAKEAQSSGDHTLDASGANQEMSKPRGDERARPEGAGKETSKGGASSRKSPPKSGDLGKA